MELLASIGVGSLRISPDEGVALANFCIEEFAFGEGCHHRLVCFLRNSLIDIASFRLKDDQEFTPGSVITEGANEVRMTEDGMESSKRVTLCVWIAAAPGVSATEAKVP